MFSFFKNIAPEPISAGQFIGYFMCNYSNIEQVWKGSIFIMVQLSHIP